ncbi:MAG: response regulator [Bryobacteraceae bacterium]
MSVPKTATEGAKVGNSPSETKRVKILLVDDTPENLIALEAALSTLGEDLVLPHCGSEALRYLLEDDFATVLLDVRMPEIDGFETAQLIRSRPRSRHIPILFLSKYNGDGQLLLGYDLGAVDFLSTPIIPQMLRAKVAVFVELHRNATILREHASVLQKAEQKFRALLEAAPDAMIMCHEEGDSRAESLFGYQRGEMIGKKIQVLVPDWSYEVPLRSDQTSDPARRPGSDKECLAVRQDRTHFPVEIATSLLQAEEGVLITTAIRRITDRKRTENEIGELNAFKELAHGFDLTHTIIRDLHGNIRVWTRGAEELYAWTADEAIGAHGIRLTAC